MFSQNKAVLLYKQAIEIVTSLISQPTFQVTNETAMHLWDIGEQLNKAPISDAGKKNYYIFLKQAALHSKNERVSCLLDCLANSFIEKSTVVDNDLFANHLQLKPPH